MRKLFLTMSLCIPAIFALGASCDPVPSTIVERRIDAPDLMLRAARAENDITIDQGDGHSCFSPSDITRIEVELEKLRAELRACQRGGFAPQNFAETQN